jgi:hypothetical protein
MPAKKSKWIAALFLSGLATASWAGVDGYQEIGTPTSAMGWACDSADYTRPVTVRFYRATSADLVDPRGRGAEFLGAVSADNYRGDLGRMCAGNHAHGFTFKYPARMGREQPYYIYAFGVTHAGNEQLLIASPRSMNPAAGADPTPQQPPREYPPPLVPFGSPVPDVPPP